MDRLRKAEALLHELDATCIIFKNDDTWIVSKKRGIAPLMEELRKNKEAFAGCVIADKVIGKAAAMMCVLGKADAVHGDVMSEAAVSVLKQYRVPYSNHQVVPYIENRTKTGSCPMEAAVSQIDGLEDAYEAVEKTLESLRRQDKS